MPRYLMLCTLVAVFGLGRAAMAQNYDQCLLIVERDAARAFEIASEWRDYGGGAPAEHCLALALVGQEKFARAAEVLDDMARAVEDDDTAKGRSDQTIRNQRANLLTQAGNAWMMADAPDKAYMLFSDALDQDGLPLELRVELLIDRARAGAGLQNQESAIEDLTSALDLGGPRADVLTFRAAAHRALDALVKARADVDAALVLDPEYHEALFERGHLRLQAGNRESAIIDWVKVTRLAPDTPAALAAEDNIASLREAATAPIAPTPPEQPALAPMEGTPPVILPDGPEAPAP